MDFGCAFDILCEEKFDNGLHVRLEDKSRQIAGDRWQVRIECSLRIAAEAVGKWFAENKASETDWRKEADNSGMILLKRLLRERNFIDQQERHQVRGELLEQLKTALFPYLQKSSLVDRLLFERFPAFEQKKTVENGENLFAHLDAEEGPADFSSLFK